MQPGALREKVFGNGLRAMQQKLSPEERIPAEMFGFKTNRSAEDAAYCLTDPGGRQGGKGSAAPGPLGF